VTKEKKSFTTLTPDLKEVGQKHRPVQQPADEGVEAQRRQEDRRRVDRL
jgi:hypothetical protein